MYENSPFPVREIGRKRYGHRITRIPQAVNSQVLQIICGLDIVR